MKQLLLFIQKSLYNDKKKLKKHFLTFNYEKLLNNKEFIGYKKVIFTFIKLMQCNNYDFEFLKTVYINSKDRFLISLIMTIYVMYQYNELVS